MKILEILTMEGFCRGCLIKYDEPLELLQYTEKNRRLFVYSTGLQVKRNDAFTFQLCKNCYLNMKLACKFKKLCRSSHKRFKNYLTLKEVDESIDLCNFLKQNDDNFRYPLMSGNSTPANQKLKDEDNESTCTSIRNFMTDMLQGEEMPDTEARIIKEVIEEEADVLDDSLDSHWLQDDASIDTDFGLNFSFSSFSTPRAVRNDNIYTPSKLSKEKEHEELNYYTSKAIIDKADHIDELNIIDEAIKNIPNNNDENIFKELAASPNNALDLVNDVSGDNLGINAQNYYVQRDIFGDNLDSIKEEKENVEDKNDQCTIDKNLEMALKNETTEKFSLDDLLVSPPVFPNMSGQLTPTIANILFSEKIEPASPINQNLGQCIEKFNNVEGLDNLDSFFNDSKEYDPDDVINGTVKNENEDILTKDEASNNKDNGISTIEANIKFEKLNENDSRDSWTIEKNFDLENFYCKLCERKCISLKSLRLHVTKRHKLRIIIKESKVYNNCKDKICELCGKIFRDRSNLLRHRKTHVTHDPNKIYQCDICRLICTNQAKLNMHKKSHNPQLNVIKEKRYMCNICGKWLSTKTNFTLHQRRHTKSYKCYCTECGKGFYRTSDLTNHMRYHTLEKPFKCPHCLVYFAQGASLTQHIKNIHLVGEKYFQCECCNVKYKKKRELLKHLKTEEMKRKKEERNRKKALKMAVSKTKKFRVSIPNM